MKNNNEYILSICIPTYNRADYLKKCLDSIVCQKPFLDGDVEIVISDNASTDNTQQVVLDYIKKYDNVKYFKNEENIRDRNFPLVLSRATGVLRKLNNDTLCLKDGSIQKMISLVKEYEKSKPVIFMANSHRENSNTVIGFSTFVKSISFWLTWIGSFTIWGDDCADIVNDTEGCELHLWQVRKILELVYSKRRAVIWDEPFGSGLVVEGKDISYGIYRVFYENYFLLLEPYFNNGTLGVDDKEYLEKDLLYNFFTDNIIIYERQTANFIYSKKENLKYVVFQRYKNKPYFQDYLIYYKKIKIVIIGKNFIKKLVPKAVIDFIRGR